MLELKDFTLRAMNSGDIHRVHAWRNLAHVKACMFSDNDITVETHRNWFESTLQNHDTDYQIIEYKQKPIGLANGVKINQPTASCYWGFYIAEPNQAKGSGTMLALLMLNHLFDTYSIQTIYGEVFEFNTASLKLHEKLSFKRIPDITKAVLKNNKYENVITLALNHDNWINIKENILKTK